MQWHDLKKRIRRFLRDPDGNIWNDSILKRLYNDEQSYICNQSGLLEYVETIRVPPEYHDSYTYEWEWANADHDGKNYQCLLFQQQSDIVFCWIWEAELLGLSTGAESDYGDQFTHPWEAWMCSPAAPVSLWFPEDFRKTKYIAWDKDPLAATTIKDVSTNDPSWHTQSGVPFAYFRKDDFSNEFYLYPHVSTPVWDDVENDKRDGGILFDDSNTESAEGQEIVDITGQVLNEDEGLATVNLSTDDNVTLIYEAESNDIETEDDTGSLPPFLQKYVEHAVLERSYAINNDGKIESLRDYWGWRKGLGKTVIEAYKRKKRTDRDYQLVTKGVGGRRTIRHPKLPDAYPAMP